MSIVVNEYPLYANSTYLHLKKNYQILACLSDGEPKVAVLEDQAQTELETVELKMVSTNEVMYPPPDQVLAYLDYIEWMDLRYYVFAVVPVPPA